MKTVCITSGLGLLLVVSLQAQPTLPTPHGPLSGTLTPSPPPQPPLAYQTAITGWTLRPGDTLLLGRGARPDKAFTHLYQRDSAAASVGQASKRAFLDPTYAGQKGVLEALLVGRAGVAQLRLLSPRAEAAADPYYVDLPQAIESGELLPPPSYRPSAQASPGLPVVGTQQLIDLKAQLEKGQINRAEYERRRKKLRQGQ